MTQEQHQQVEIAFKTRGALPLPLIAEFVQLIIDIVRGLMAKKKGATVQEKLADLEWLMNEVVLKAIHVHAREMADMKDSINHLMSEVQKLKK